MHPPPSERRRARAVLLAAPALLALGACGPRGAAPTPSPSAPLRERIAALALRQTAFGAISVIPVRFERSRISKPFEDGGRTLYCVSSRMMGRDFGEAERPKIVVRALGETLTVLEDEADVCEGHRTEPFTELDTPTTGRP